MFLASVFPLSAMHNLNIQINIHLSCHPSPLCTAVEEGETSESGGNWEESTIQTGERMGPHYEEIPSSHTNNMRVDFIHTDAVRCTKAYSKSLLRRGWRRWNEQGGRMVEGKKNREKCWFWRQKVEMQGEDGKRWKSCCSQEANWRQRDNKWDMEERDRVCAFFIALYGVVTTWEEVGEMLDFSA